jgi:hypothetical protein
MKKPNEYYICRNNWRIYYEWELQNNQKGTILFIPFFLLCHVLGGGSAHIIPIYGIIMKLHS